jgi:hypothetical protein
MKLPFVRCCKTLLADLFIFVDEHGGHEHVYVSHNIIKELNI